MVNQEGGEGLAPDVVFQRTAGELNDVKYTNIRVLWHKPQKEGKTTSRFFGEREQSRELRFRVVRNPYISGAIGLSRCHCFIVKGTRKRTGMSDRRNKQRSNAGLNGTCPSPEWPQMFGRWVRCLPDEEQRKLLTTWSESNEEPEIMGDIALTKGDHRT